LKSSTGSASAINGGVSSSSLLEANPIVHEFQIGAIIGTSGPELSWRMFEAHRKADNK
ncbi:hypothetical protein B4U79_05553, partial [Dinothrombium tinctorium]